MSRARACVGGAGVGSAGGQEPGEEGQRNLDFIPVARWKLLEHFQQGCGMA